MNYAAFCYQQLLAGEDTDEANAAGWHMAIAFELVTRFLEKK